MQAINGRSRIYNARSASNYSYQQRGQFLDGTYPNTLTPTVYRTANCYQPKYQTAATFRLQNITQVWHNTISHNQHFQPLRTIINAPSFQVHFSRDIFNACYYYFAKPRPRVYAFLREFCASVRIQCVREEYPHSIHTVNKRNEKTIFILIDEIFDSKNRRFDSNSFKLKERAKKGRRIEQNKFTRDAV